MHEILKQCRICLAAAVVCVTAATSQASLIASDQFEYSGASLDGQNGGTGWNGAWVGAFTLSDDGISLTYPDGTSDAGSRISEISASSATRPLASGIDFDVDGTYYYSFLVNKADAGSIDVRLVGGSSGRWRIRWSSTEALSIGVTSSTGATVGTYAADQTLLVVTKLQTVATGSDTMWIKVFQPGDEVVEPTTWDASNAVAVSGLVLDTFGIYRNAAGAQVDAVRIGTTFADVLPEPASLGLMTTAGLLILSRCQRGGF